MTEEVKRTKQEITEDCTYYNLIVIILYECTFSKSSEHGFHTKYLRVRMI